MRSQWIIAVLTASLTVATTTRAGIPAFGDGSGNTQFRRTVTDTDRSAFGNAQFRVKDLNQSCQTVIEQLGETDFGVFIAFSPYPDTNTPVYAVSPLDRADEKHGVWKRLFAAKNGFAPLEFPFIDTLHDLSGYSILIGKADSKLYEVGVTNVVNGVTNIIVGIPLPVADSTNKVGIVLWAPIPNLVTNQNDYSFSGKAKLLPPTIPPVSPDGKGTLKVRHVAPTGQNVFDLKASGLLRGQTYTVYIGDIPGYDPNILLPIGEMVPVKSGKQHRFIRDTAYGDPLPFQVRYITELSGYRLDIRDNFGNIHLTLIIP
jgi:hypothetical protein